MCKRGQDLAAKGLIHFLSFFHENQGTLILCKIFGWQSNPRLVFMKIPIQIFDARFLVSGKIGESDPTMRCMHWQHISDLAEVLLRKIGFGRSVAQYKKTRDQGRVRGAGGGCVFLNRDTDIIIAQTTDAEIAHSNMNPLA